MPTWVLERNVFADGAEALARAAAGAGGDVISWTDDWWFDGRLPKDLAGPVVFHGSLSNADRIARELPWNPGSFCATDRFACSSWWPQVSQHLVPSRYLLTTASQLAADGAPEDFGDQVFVRPDSALKPFSGRVLERSQISLAALDHGFYYEDENLPVVVAPALPISTEWRFVIVAGTVIAGSAYSADGRQASRAITDADAAWLYAAELTTDLDDPDPAFILDVCETPDGLRLLELNPFSGADLYNCDRPSVVRAIHALVT